MTMKHKMKTAGVVALGVLVVAVLCFLVFVKLDAGYFIVYMTNGEVYVGHVSTFPRFKLTDGYIFQAVQDASNPQKKTFQLNPLKDAVWAPKYLYINKSQVLFLGPLSESSSIFKTLTNFKTLTDQAKGVTSPDSPPTGTAQ